MTAEVHMFQLSMCNLRMHIICVQHGLCTFMQHLYELREASLACQRQDLLSERATVFVVACNMIMQVLSKAADTAVCTPAESVADT